jgi:hypothetical protein
MSKVLLYGTGVNDADYVVNPTVDGKIVTCPFFQKWKSMLSRCYSENLHARRPKYIGCYVEADWLTFSKFKSWMEGQDWKGKELDKDLLVCGNKIYSSSTCVFVDSVTNSFTLDSSAIRGSFPVGVHFSKSVKKLMSKCSNPFTKKQEFLGYFDCPQEAHEAWKKRKHELALQLADLQTDERVAAALRVRYL